MAAISRPPFLFKYSLKAILSSRSRYITSCQHHSNQPKKSKPPGCILASHNRGFIKIWADIRRAYRCIVDTFTVTIFICRLTISRVLFFDLRYIDHRTASRLSSWQHNVWRAPDLLLLHYCLNVQGNQDGRNIGAMWARMLETKCKRCIILKVGVLLVGSHDLLRLCVILSRTYQLRYLFHISVRYGCACRYSSVAINAVRGTKLTTCADEPACSKCFSVPVGEMTC